MIKRLSIFCVIVFCFGCTSFRGEGNGVTRDSEELTTSGFWNAGDSFPIMSGDSGERFLSSEEINKRTPLLGEAYSIRQELEKREQELPEEERANFNKTKNLLSNDSERIYLLELSPKERENYLQNKVEERKLTTIEEDKYSKSPVKKIVVSELFFGMSKADVLSSWGDPSTIDVAGDPREQNERWSFVVDNKVKSIYFESGRVQGWKLD